MLTGILERVPLQVWLKYDYSPVVVASHGSQSAQHVLPGANPAIMPDEPANFPADTFRHSLVQYLPVQRAEILNGLPGHNLEL